MIDHAAAIARLQAMGIFKQTGGAAEVAALIDGKAAVGLGPGAFVVPMADRPGAPHGSRDIAQPVTVTFGIVLMVRFAGDATGGKATQNMQAIQAQLQAAFIGWRPGNGFEPAYYAGGHLLDFQPQALWWLEEFSTVTYAGE